MKTIDCPACRTTNIDPAPQSVCTNCGEPLAVALFQQSVDELQKVTQRMKELTAPRKSFYSFNGFGTTLLDYRAQPDGTYAATRWVIALLLPIVPLKSYIIRPNKREATYGHETTSFEILGETSLSAARILRTYLLAVVGLAPVIVGFMYSSEINRAMSGPKAFGVMLLGIIWAGYVIAFKLKNEGRAYNAAASNVSASSDRIPRNQP